ncbi:MAG: TIGR00730 family Rossman fold protein [Cyclobacteriaceae bacterium]|nr:TIGR00730 family Rossman fold protein [Cytophagales bacterium]MBX2899321.1 TIGR00730 family Rossman fold protein [Cyclobacteriaceae bacterium]
MNICVFCGSGTGGNPVYAEAARTLGQTLAAGNHTLVYGGGNIGLMGIVADAVLQSGGRVIGVIPDFLMQKEVGHKGITQLEVVGSMHERKRRMADLAQAFIAMPGGWGTLDELAEILTWKQLGLIKADVGILNTNKYFDALLSQMEKMVQDGFLAASNFASITIASQPQDLIGQLTAPQ